MNKILGIISCNYHLDGLKEMTQNRPIGVTPFGGRYAIADFILSSMVNSGVKTIGFVTPYLYRPILDHLGSGKEWNLDRKKGGLFILPGVTNWIYSHTKFSLQDLKKNKDFLLREKADYVLLSGSNGICNIDFIPPRELHKTYGADITLLYKDMVVAPEGSQGLTLDGHGRVTAIQPSPKGKASVFADMILIDLPLLLEIVQESKEEDALDLMEVITSHLGKYKVVGYPIPGFYGSITSLESYYAINMSLMDDAVSEELFSQDNKIITRIKDNPPTKYGPTADIVEAIVSSGCLLEGQVERSLIFRGCTIGAGSSVRGSILMHDIRIGKNVVLDHVVLDKDVTVSDGTILKGEEGHPVFVPKAKHL